MSTWRVGNKVKLNVYEGDRPAFQCHTPEEAARIVVLLNDGERIAALEQTLHDIYNRVTEELAEPPRSDTKLLVWLATVIEEAQTKPLHRTQDVQKLVEAALATHDYIHRKTKYAHDPEVKLADALAEALKPFLEKEKR